MSEGLGNKPAQRGESDYRGDHEVSHHVAVMQQTSLQPGQLVAGVGGNPVVLRADQAIESIAAQGRDLVITLTDGTRIVVPDGALFVPQIVVDGVPIPPANVAALLVGSEPEPAAGENASSGGNFTTDPGEIQSAFGLGDLLPYTELPFSVDLEEEVIPVPADDDDEVIIAILDSELVDDEANLPEGSSPNLAALTKSGTFTISSPDGLDTLTVNGVAFVENGVFVPGRMSLPLNSRTVPHWLIG